MIRAVAVALLLSVAVTCAQVSVPGTPSHAATWLKAIQAVATTGAQGAYYDDDPDGIMQYCTMWLAVIEAVSTIVDQSGTGNDGTRPVSGSTYETEGDTDFLDGDGSNNYTTWTDPLQNNPTNWAFGLWVRFNSGGSALQNRTLHGDAPTSWNFNWHITTLNNTSGLFYSRVEKTGGGFVNLYSTTSLDDLAWHFIAVTGDGTNARLYVDMNVEATAAFSDTLNHETSGGAASGGNPTIDGDWDDAFAFKGGVITSNHLQNMYDYAPYSP